MTTVTIAERIVIIKGVKNRAVHFDFRWQWILRCGPRADTSQAAAIECQFAQDSRRSAGPDWKQSVLSAKGRS